MNLGNINLLLGFAGSIYAAYVIGDAVGGYELDWPVTIGVFVVCMFGVIVNSVMMYVFGEILDNLNKITNTLEKTKNN